MRPFACDIHLIFCLFGLAPFLTFLAVAAPVVQSPGGAAADLERNAARTGFLDDEFFQEHKTGSGFPESPDRLTAIRANLEKKGLLAKLLILRARPAKQEWLTAVHAPVYLERIKKSCAESKTHLDSMDVPISPRSYDVALAAAGGVTAMLDAVMTGCVRNGFCAVRPPGHHASRDRAMGFCLLNNVAVAARYLQRQHHLKKILIVDWDVHHGNGTQAIFNSDPTVFYFSVHQSPFYPGTGGADDTGTGTAVGTKLNVPLPAGSGDAAYKKALLEQLRPAALAFHPDFVLISAGFDAHQGDTLGGMAVSTAGYAELTRIVMEIARECCQGRLVSVLEGGYNLENLAAAVEAHLRQLMQ